MKNYQKSDYALNKCSKGIVYIFADSIVEITLEDYLAENPGKTVSDFQSLKGISDEIYFSQDRAVNAQTAKNLTLHSLGDVADATALSPEDQIKVGEDTKNRKEMAQMVEFFFDRGRMTPTQRRRFSFFYRKGLSTRQIAALEGVSQHSVWVSLQACEKKFIKFLLKHCVTPF